MPKPVTHHIAGIPFDDCRQWYEDPNTLAELYEFMAVRGEQPLDVSGYIRHAYDWEPQYREMLSRKGREVMLEQAKACTDAPKGMEPPKDDPGGTDAQSAA